MKYFTSDLHFWHKNIIKFCDRPFVSVKEMNKILIKNYNNIVSIHDTCYIIGDFAMVSKNEYLKLEPIVKKLNGRKILILGNHDECNIWDYIKIGFESVHTSLELNNGWILNHDPAISCTDRNKLFIVGHVHDLFKIQKNCINVGVDVWDYNPISENQIKNML